MKETPVLYCDLDGTVRFGKDELGHFVNTVEDVKVFPEVPDLLWGYRDLGWRIVGVSNQGGVGLGFMTMQACFEQMGETQRQTRLVFDKIVFCAHKPDAGCPCRKPKAGMVTQTQHWLTKTYLAHGESFPMNLALFVGDRPEDEGCAVNAGIRFLDAETWRKGVHLDTLRNS